MTDTHIKCPYCGYEIPISEAFTAQIRGELWYEGGKVRLSFPERPAQPTGGGPHLHP